MIAVIREVDDELGTAEKMIALKILLAIYLHDKRYFEALRDIEELLNDPEMQGQREYLFLRREEIRRALVNLLNKRRPSFLQLVFDVFHNPA